jgi:hypothetical protein
MHLHIHMHIQNHIHKHKHSTVAGNWQQGYADGEGAAARFNRPTAVVVDREATIIVIDMDNNRLRRLTGRHVTTLA